MGSVPMLLPPQGQRCKDRTVPHSVPGVHSLGVISTQALSFAGFCDSADEFHVLDGELWIPGDALGPHHALGSVPGQAPQQLSLPLLWAGHARLDPHHTTAEWSCPRSAGELVWHEGSMPDHHVGQVPPCPCVG